jgi:hypothetical protein
MFYRGQPHGSSVSAFISNFHPYILPDAAEPKQLLLSVETIRHATGARLYDRLLGKSGVLPSTSIPQHLKRAAGSCLVSETEDQGRLESKLPDFAQSDLR